MLSNEKKHQIFLKLRLENYQASLRLEGIGNHRSIDNKNNPIQSKEDMVEIMQTIRSDEDYKAILKEIEHLMAAEVGTPEGNRLKVLVSLIEAYETKYPRD